MDAGAPTSPVILLVEDDPLVRLVTAEMLRDTGFQVLEAETGDEAIGFLRQPNPDIAMMVSDVVMPGSMSGIQLADWVRLHHPDLPILLVSGWRGWADFDGRHELLAKPYTADQFIARVRERACPAAMRASTPAPQPTIACQPRVTNRPAAALPA